MTQLKAAFEKAGYKDSREEWPSEELLAVAIRAMTRHADDMDATQHAVFRGCKDDVALLRQLILPWWRQCTASVIGEARRTILAKQKAGELESAQERRAAKVISLVRERELAKEAKERREEEARITALNDQHHREFLVRCEAWRKTKASNFLIEDQPFWEVSTLQARQYQRRQTQGGKFLDLVLSGVPEDDRPISYYRRPDEINALWEASFA